jgi:hypothetical protein
MKKTLWAVAAIGFCLLAQLAFAQDTPDFSGRWNMNLEKSDFGGMERPSSGAYVIRHSGANLALDYTQDGKTTHLDFMTDGQERVTESNNDADILTRVFWAGPVLTFESRQKARPAHQTEAIRWTSRWQLSPDKKQFAIQKHFVTPGGELDQKLIFDRQ